MKTNGLLAILALGLALLAYVERAEQPFAAQVAKQKAQSEPLFAVRPEEVAGIRIQDVRGCIVVRKEGSTAATADELLAILARTRIVRRMAVPSSDVSVYGLVPPQIHINLLRREGTIAQHISIGDSTPTGSALYAAVEGKSEILLVGSYFLRAVDMVLSQVRGTTVGSAELACRP